MLDTSLQVTFPETLQKPVWTFEKLHCNSIHAQQNFFKSPCSLFSHLSAIQENGSSEILIQTRNRKNLLSCM